MDDTAKNSQEIPLGKVRQPLVLLIPSAFLILSVTICLAVSITFYIENKRVFEKEELKAIGFEAEHLEHQVEDIYETAADKLLLLSYSPSIQEFILNPKAIDEPKSKANVEEVLTALLVSSEAYREVALIELGDDKRERLRMVKNAGFVSSVATTALLKGESGHLANIISTRPRDTAYFSELSLRKINGEIVLPHQPVLYAVMPLYQKRQEKILGMILIDIDFDLSLLDIINGLPEELDFLLADDSGSYLYHPNGNKKLAFHPEGADSIVRDFEALRGDWGSYNDLPYLDLQSADGRHFIGFYKKLELSKYGYEHGVNLVTLEDKETIDAQLVGLRNRSLLYGSALVLAAFLLSVIIARRIAGPISQMTDSVKLYEHTGKLDNLPVENETEVGLFARSFQNLLLEVNEALHEQQEGASRLSAILDSAADAIITIDQHGRILSFNKAAVLIFGYQESEVLGQPVTLLMSAQEGSKHQSYIDRFIDTRQSRLIGKPRELEGIKKNGNSFPMMLSISEVSTSIGHIFSGIIRDISVEKALEEEKRLALAKAEESAQLKSEFLASMSHEIRTPMNGVLGMLGLLRKDNLTSPQQHKVKLAYTSAQSLLTIINDILDFSKIEARKIEFEMLDFNLPAILGDFVESIAPRAQEKGLEIILDTRDVTVSMVKGDPIRIRQILNNLVGNAIKFTETGEIAIRSKLEESANGKLIFVCSVQDSGIGIHSSKIDNVFESFTQEDASTTRQYGGTGLGLAIAKQLCELMGGRMRVESELGKGSCFEFSAELSKAEHAQVSLPDIDISKRRMLIVDDNKTNRDVLQGQLNLWRVKADEVDSAQLALDYISASYDKNNLYDVVFIDFQMPTINGLQLGEMIRADSRFDSIKLVMMTSVVIENEIEKYRSVGFDAYFSKPVTVEDLHRAIYLLSDDRSDAGFVTHSVTQSVASHSGSKFSNHLRLLLVEDNSINQQVVQGQLEEFELSCDFANNGVEALDALRTNTGDLAYDLIMMDCQMPEMDGFEATRAIREGKAGSDYSHIPIIALTANAMKGDRERCLQAGMNDYLSKPLDESELEQVLEKWLLNKAKGSAARKLNRQGELLVWDEESFLRRVRGKTARAVMLIDSFLDHTPGDIASLIKYIEEKNYEEGLTIAHGLKGVTANLSAEQLSNDMLNLERACRVEDIDAISGQLSALSSHFTELSLYLNEYKARH